MEGFEERKKDRKEKGEEMLWIEGCEETEGKQYQITSNKKRMNEKKRKEMKESEKETVFINQSVCPLQINTQPHGALMPPPLIPSSLLCGI